MNKKEFEQEEYCLKAEETIDYLRTTLYMIDDMKNYEYYDKILEKLRRQINEIFWNI